MELDLLGHAEPVVKQARQGVSASSPRLDLEGEIVILRNTELDLSRLEVPAERDEPEGIVGDFGHSHGAVPRSRHCTMYSSLTRIPPPILRILSKRANSVGATRLGSAWTLAITSDAVSRASAIETL